MSAPLREAPVARRVRAKRLRRLVVVGAVLYVLLLAGLSYASQWGYFWLLERPGLRLTKVAVQGLVRLQRAEVLAAAGVTEGASLVALDLARLEERLTRLPWVKSAEADLEGPLRLALNIEEKTPVALIRLDSLYYLDQNGCLIKRLSPHEGMDFPVITGIPPSDFNTSRKLLCGRVLPLLAQLDRDADDRNLGRGAGLGSEVSEVQVGPEGRLSLYTTDGLLVRLGDRDWQVALREAGRVVSELRRRGSLAEVAAVDAGCPMRVFVKLSRGSKLLAARGA